MGSNTNLPNTPSDSLIDLQKGGLLVRTSLGFLQYGIPPETVKDSLELGLPVPEFYIIPRERFNWNDGISLMEFEFPVYYNFFLRNQNKTKIICDKETMEQIRVIFQETLLGPVEFSNFDAEFSNGYRGKPNLPRELAYFARNPFGPESSYRLDQFLQFHLFDQKGQALVTPPNGDKTKEVRVIKGDDVFSVYDGGKLLTTFHDEVQVRHASYSVPKTFSAEEVHTFTPPLFGVTVLGSSHGFDCQGSTTGFIVWVNGKGVMVDPPPYSSKALRSQGIPPSLIEKIIITHCHADHDSGAFHKIIEAAPVEFLSTATILNSFLRKYSGVSGLSVSEISKLFQHRTIIIGHPLFILGARFTFSYSFHSIPALAFEAEFQGKRFFFSGDTLYNPPLLRELYIEGVLSKERFESLALRDLSRFDLILHEAGIPPIHTPLKVLAELPEKILKVLYLIHIAQKDVPKDQGLKPVPVGLKGTLVLVPAGPRIEDVTLSNLDLLCSVELVTWVPLNRIVEIVNCLREVHFGPGESILKAKSDGSDFYMVKQGVVRVFSDEKDRQFSKLCYRGEYFGESAISGDGQRLANVETVTETVLLCINQYDFRWIFNYQTRGDEVPLGPLELIKNLSEVRRAHEGEFINANLVVSKMTENQKCLLNMLVKEVNVKKGQVLWKRNVSPRFCFFVKSGQVKVKYPQNKIRKRAVVDPGTLVGDFPHLLKQEACASSVKCLADGAILKLSNKDLQLFLNQYPGFFIAIMDRYYLF